MAEEGGGDAATPAADRMTPWRSRYLRYGRGPQVTEEGGDEEDLRPSVMDGLQKPYSHTREPAEVEQVNIGLQADPDESSKELCISAISQVRSDLLSQDQVMLWDLFCQFDCSGGMTGKLDRYQLTGVFAAVSPESGAREVSRWIEELVTPAPGEEASDGGTVTFVELLDWWDRSTAESSEGRPAGADTRLPQIREDLAARGRQKLVQDLATGATVFASPGQQRVDTMSPGELAVSVDGLLETIIQVRFWLQARLNKEAELKERKLYLIARQAGENLLDADSQDKYKFMFQRYVSELPGQPAEGEAPPPEEPAEEPELSEKAKKKLAVWQQEVEDGDMTEEEFDKKKSALMQKEKSAAPGGGGGPAPTIHVGDELKALCGLLGIQMTFREWEIIEGQGVYPPRMDKRSFLCFIAVRLGRVKDPDESIIPGL